MADVPLVAEFVAWLRERRPDVAAQLLPGHRGAIQAELEQRLFTTDDVTEAITTFAAAWVTAARFDVSEAALTAWRRTVLAYRKKNPNGDDPQNPPRGRSWDSEDLAAALVVMLQRYMAGDHTIVLPYPTSVFLIDGMYQMDWDEDDYALDFGHAVREAAHEAPFTPFEPIEDAEVTLDPPSSWLKVAVNRVRKVEYRGKTGKAKPKMINETYTVDTYVPEQMMVRVAGVSDLDVRIVGRPKDQYSVVISRNGTRIFTKYLGTAEGLFLVPFSSPERGDLLGAEAVYKDSGEIKRRIRMMLDNGGVDEYDLKRQAVDKYRAAVAEMVERGGRGRWPEYARALRERFAGADVTDTSISAGIGAYLKYVQEAGMKGRLMPADQWVWDTFFAWELDTDITANVADDLIGLFAPHAPDEVLTIQWDGRTESLYFNEGEGRITVGGVDKPVSAATIWRAVDRYGGQTPGVPNSDGVWVSYISPAARRYALAHAPQHAGAKQPGLFT